MIQTGRQPNKFNQIIKKIFDKNKLIKNSAIILIAFSILTGIFTILFLMQPTIPIYNVDTAAYASDVYVRDNYAYMADSTEGLAIIDVTDPKNPGNPYYVYTNGIANDIYIEGNYAYVANGIAGLAIIDISNPSSAFLTGVTLTPGYAVSVSVKDQTAYIADYHKGLAIINITNIYLPTLIYSIDLPGETLGVKGSGDVLYVTGTFELIPLCFANNRIKIYSSLNPTNLVLINNECFRGYAMETVISGNYAFTVTWDKGLVTWNASDPEDFRSLGYRSVLEAAVDLHIHNDIAYIANSEDGLSIIDVSNKEKIGQPIYFYLEGETQGVFVSGDYAYVANGANGLTIVDIYGNSQNIINYQIIRAVFLFGLIISAAIGSIFEISMVIAWSRKKKKVRVEEEELESELAKSFAKITLSGAILSGVFGAFVGLMVESGRIITGNTRFVIGVSLITTMIMGIVIVIPFGIIIGAAFMDNIVLSGLSVTIAGLLGLMLGWEYGEKYGEAYENATGLASGLIIGMLVGAFISIVIEVSYLLLRGRKRKFQNFDSLMREVDQIASKAKIFRKKEELEDFFILSFLNIKKLINILYLKFYNIVIPEDKKIEDVIKDFEIDFNLITIELTLYTHLKEIRDDILGKGMKLKETDIMEFQKTFENIINGLKTAILNFNE